jgi:hypothetical protein
MCPEVPGYCSALMFIVSCGYWRRIAADFAREIQEPVQISLLFTMGHADFAGEFRRKQ